ncbi:MAG TPA: acyltransferase, partial [Candidatus Competibacteraceae bacterium]|nr:acyltransferase [Candidatus Competibacteraceae bacterium]
MMAYHTYDELQELGFFRIGKEVFISNKVSLYKCSKIQIGNNVRIDDFCVLSAGEGGIKIGDYIHIAPFCSIMGAGKIEMENFSGLSSKVSIYSSSDDYSGKFLTNPTVPLQYKGVHSADVFL